MAVHIIKRWLLLSLLYIPAHALRAQVIDTVVVQEPTHRQHTVSPLSHQNVLRIEFIKTYRLRLENKPYEFTDTLALGRFFKKNIAAIRKKNIEIAMQESATYTQFSSIVNILKKYKLYKFTLVTLKDESQ